MNPIDILLQLLAWAGVLLAAILVMLLTYALIAIPVQLIKQARRKTALLEAGIHPAKTIIRTTNPKEDQ